MAKLRMWAVSLVVPVVLATAGVLPAQAAATITISSIVPSPTSSQMVGTTVHWVANASSSDGSAIEYRFAVGPQGAATVLSQDFSATNTWDWTPIQEATYTVTVTAQSPGGGNAVSLTSAAFTITSRVTGTSPVITPTSNPLVVLYSAPPCATGTISAQFGYGSKAGTYTSTPTRTCNGKSANWYLAGMRPSTAYQVRYTEGTVHSSWQSFTTGALPSTVGFPTFTTPIPAGSSTSYQDDEVFTTSANTTGSNAFVVATDLGGKVNWYYDPARYPTLQSGNYVSRPLDGGTVLVMLGESAAPQGLQAIREIDLAGGALRQTTVGRLNEQLTALGKPNIISTHHDLVRLPNGHTLTFGYLEQLSTSAQGGTPSQPVDILGDVIIDLDQNFQVSWVWNAFDHLDINRAAVLGETCATNQAGCPVQLKLATVANDWLHSNAIVYSPTDHNLLVSLRHQDWIVKLDYQDGAGTGNVLWHLGNQGDFTLTDSTGSGGTFPWFSHQHGPQLNGTNLLAFDNGNTRCAPPNNVGCDSRGQQYALNESAKTATLSVNDDMGNYSFALGLAQLMPNGDLSFTSGAQNTGTGPFGQDEEFTSGGVKNYVLQKPNLTYRAYRMTSLYKN